MASRARAFQLACRARLDTTSTLQHSAPSLTATRTIHSTNPNPATNSSPNPSSSPSSLPHNLRPSRRAVTVTSDDGRYAWSELSRGEKAARTTQQSFNFLFVTAGAVGFICVSYFLWDELFRPESHTVLFNAAVSRLKASPEVRARLGPASELKAYGEPSTTKWARARPLLHSTETDRFGTTHFRMAFWLEGPDGKGRVNVHMSRGKEEGEMRYETLSLSVQGEETLFVERRDEGVTKNVKKFLGFGLR